MLYSAKYKKMGFKSSAWEDATFHSTFISHTKISRKLENILNKLLKKHTVTCFTSDCGTYVRPLKDTTTHLLMFPNKDTPCGRENECIWERSRDVPDVVNKKRDCFLVCFVQNIRLQGRWILQQYQTIGEIFFRFRAKLR